MKVLNGLDLSNQKIINLADPSVATDAATKQYVDNVSRGLYWKMPVRAASTTNITIATPGASIDGVSMSANDRFLAKDQTTASQNGIYIWNGAATPATRALDADNGSELAPGTAVTVTEGTVNADKAFIIISDAAVTIGTTAISWGQLGGGTTYNANNGVQLTGSTFQGVASPAGGLTVGSTGFSIDTSIVARKAAGNLGDGSATSISVAHNLGTLDVQAMLKEVSGNTWVITDFTTPNTSHVTFTFATAPTSNQFRWMVQG